LNGAPPVNLTLSPSPGLATCIIAAHAAAAACLWLLLPGHPGMALAALVLALGVAAARDRALLAAASSVIGLGLAAGDEAVLHLRDGRRVPAPVGQGRFVSGLCVTLPVRAPGRRSLLVTSGMLEPESFRILRVWALWGRVPGQAPVASRQLAS
jgi:hypothetical protein